MFYQQNDPDTALPLIGLWSLGTRKEICVPALDAERGSHAGARHLDPNVTESPDWPTMYYPPSVIRLVTPADEEMLLRRRRLALVPQHRDGSDGR